MAGGTRISLSERSPMGHTDEKARVWIQGCTARRKSCGAFLFEKREDGGGQYVRLAGDYA